MRSSLSFVVMLVLGASIAGCASTSPAGDQVSRSGPARPARINHLAFFKLKNPADAAELVADCDAKLARIPGVVSYFAGRHLDTGRGERVDGNYDVGFYVGFMSEDDLASYVKHPNHVALVGKWRPRWEWIRVHDVLDDSP